MPTNNNVLIPIFFVLLFLITSNNNAQISQGGEPIGWINKQDIPSVTKNLPSINIDALLAEDVITEKHKDIPFRFAYAHQVNYNLSNSGTWINTKHGKLWRLRVKSANAYSLNVTFKKYKLIEGAKLFIYNKDKTYFIGGFTSKNNKQNEQLGSTPIPGDDIIIELYEPNNSNLSSQIEIKAIAHDYKGIFNKIFKSFGSSGSCNINTACSQGNGWEDQINSVALITLGDGTRICTGSLVNNTAQDATPYFLTADHCLNASVGTWMFIFGYESSACTPSQDGILTNSISGATLRASNANSDFGLLELSAIPPANYNTYYSGWDNSDALTTNQTCIHHPSGDVKKISKDNNAAIKNTGNALWTVSNWEEGTTEGGSSGSPLFDQNKRIIGQLLGGSASCANNGSDNYGRFGVSWNGASASTRLKDWLDPNNTNTSVLNGLNPNVSQLANDLSINNINSFPNSICGNSVNVSFNVNNIGTNTVNSFTYSIKLNSTTIATSTWNGSLASGQNITINYGTTNVISGNNNLEITISNPNGTNDGNPLNNTTNRNFNVFTPNASVDIKITLDNYGSETTWEIKNSGGTTLYSGGPYSDFANGTQVKEIVCLENGCYDFIIKDQANDGICCGFGNGSYTLDVFSTNLVNSNGQFFGQETKPFCITTASLDEVNFDDISIYPNPTKTQINIENKDNKPLNNVTIINILGEQVLSLNQIKNHKETIDISDLTAGTYFIRITATNGSAISKKILVIN